MLSPNAQGDEKNLLFVAYCPNFINSLFLEA